MVHGSALLFGTIPVPQRVLGNSKFVLFPLQIPSASDAYVMLCLDRLIADQLAHKQRSSLSISSQR